MANPAPTINQINAFNATQGTIIDFNIIGGTELVRSNRIYIYDLSDNSLICTHLYVSTESIHELPPNTDSSIVYESGKSSADFVNGAQYYAQIQTFTDTAGTEGGSGLSVAKMFWCLVDPTLTITTIPSTISTTSYNVSATYDANTSVVSNIIQQYQFSLYSATGSLLQSSGVIVGSGTQQGTSTAYDISYNFTGLSVGSSYYVVVDVTTTQGMSVSTQSNTFTVSIETPTLGEATVVNNACDGYISVTSNLSSEYGGSASGEIATFVTDSVNDVSSLKVTLEPQQDGTPWIGTDHDTTPYLNRAMPTQSNSYNRESGVIVGGTVGWNQLIQNGNFADTSTWSKGGTTSDFTVSDNVATIIGSGYTRVYQKIQPELVSGHKYFVTCDFFSVGSGNGVRILVAESGTGNPVASVYTNVTADTWKTVSAIFDPQYNGTKYLTVGEAGGNASTLKLRNVMFIDLTAMFNPTIADYVYSLEQATAGSGIAWLRSYGFLTEDYIPYSQPTLQSVQATAHKTYDADGNVIGNYALDSSLTLRGIPKLDASNNLYYDGDTYASDGTVTRKHIQTTYNGAEGESWIQRNNGTNQAYFAIKVGNNGAVVSNAIICDKFVQADIRDATSVTGINLVNSSAYNGAFIYIRTATASSTTSAEFKTWLASNPITVVYELATPTTENADPYTNPQIVDPDGTEEYVTSNYVPVGHDSTYSLVCPIYGHDDVTVEMRGKNLLKNTVESGSGTGTFAWMVNADRSISLSGTPTSNAFIVLSDPYQLVGGQYCMKKSGNANIQMLLRLGTAAGSSKITATTNDATSVIDEGTYVGVIRVASGTNTDGITLYPQLELGSTATDYEPYQGQTYTTDLPQTVYGGTLDLVSGELVLTKAKKTFDGTEPWRRSSGKPASFFTYWSQFSTGAGKPYQPFICSYAKMAGSFDSYTLGECWSDSACSLYIQGDTNMTIAEFESFLADKYNSGSPVQVCYELATPQTIQLTPQEIRTILGTNNVWSEDGDVEITYNIPITNLLVKRQDVVDVSGTWLTLYSQPITQASDMDFTFIDFLNQYGKTYKYALVPLLTQQQSGVEVEVEGGYTVSDEVQSIFDGVFIADSTGSQKCKANVGYGDVDMNQAVGTITPIGAKYPVVITNSKNQYHNGSISGTIVPDDYYFNGNLSRIDMVNKRNELEQFLTNKRAKIIKDWNSNIWLVMMMDNITCTFNNEYGMGIVNFNANWIEVGDPTNQQDLQATGLIDVGGV